MISIAYKKGYRAGYAGNTLNPYKIGSKDYKDWVVGYQAALADKIAGL